MNDEKQTPTQPDALKVSCFIETLMRESDAKGLGLSGSEVVSITKEWIANGGVSRIPAQSVAKHKYLEATGGAY